MKKVFAIVAIAWVVSLCLQSMSVAAEKLKIVGLNDSLKIPSNEIPVLAKRAQGGDRSAAERLSSYYGYYLDDKKKWQYYLELAATNGSAMAIESLVTIYSTSPELFDVKRALQFRKRLRAISKKRNVTFKSNAEWGYEMYIENFVGQANKKRGLIFLEYAAKNGSQKARKELIELYLNDADIANPARASYWKSKS
ncbi:MAG: hypothetical protein V7609_868 [Verrucomicrobiota bacterium]